MAILFAIIFIFGLLTWLVERRKNPQQFRRGWRGLFDGLWWSAVTMTTVGYGDKTPKSPSGKMVALIWMFVAVIFISGLTASIASSLTVTRMNVKEQELDGFKDKLVGTVGSSATYDFLRNRFFKKIKTYDLPNQGLYDLREGNIKAFLYDEPILQYRIKEEPANANVIITHMRFNRQQYAWGFNHSKTALRDQVTSEMLHIIESADWERALREYGLEKL